MGVLLFQKCADLLQLVATRAGVVEQIAQLRGVGLDLLHGLLVFGIALEHQDLMLGSTFLARRVDGVEEGAHGELSGRRLDH